MGKGGSGLNRVGEGCVEVKDGLMEYLLGELEESAIAEFRRHLHRCRACQAELDLLVPVQEQLSTLLSSSDSIHSVVPSTMERNRVLEGAFAVRTPTTLTQGVSGRNAERRVGWRAGQGAGWRVRRMSPWSRTRLWAVAGSIASVAAVALVWRTEFAPNHVQAPTQPTANTVAATTATASNTAANTATNLVAGEKPSFPTIVLAISLLPSKAYPSAKGAANATIDEKQGNLVLNVSHVPVQPKRACYNVWGIVDGQYYTLGEFLVDESGTGRITVSLQPGLAYSKIEVTLEPRWGDASPEGPKVLQSSAIKI